MPTFEKLVEVATALDLSVHWLATGVGPKQACDICSPEQLGERPLGIRLNEYLGAVAKSRVVANGYPVPYEDIVPSIPTTVLLQQLRWAFVRRIERRIIERGIEAGDFNTGVAWELLTDDGVNPAHY